MASTALWRGAHAHDPHPGVSMAGSSAMSTNQGRSGLARGRRSFSLRSAVLTESRATSSQLNWRPEKSRHGFRLGSGSPRLRGWSPCSLRCSGPARFGSVGGTRFRPRAAGCRPPPGETRMIGSARSPRPHEKVMQHSRWPGPASPKQVSRSRAMPARGRWPVLPVGARCRAPSWPQRYAPRREPSRRLGSAGWGLCRRGPAGRCAGPHRENWPEVGVPSRPRASAQSARRGSARLRRAAPG